MATTEQAPAKPKAEPKGELFRKLPPDMMPAPAAPKSDEK